MAFVVGALPGYDAAKCIKLALVHDVAEAVVGDITPHDGVPPAEKHAREAAVVERMQVQLGLHGPFAGCGAELFELWREYEGCATPEARLVKDLDKLEMILQAHEYEGQQGMALEEFFRTTAGKFLTPAGAALAQEVARRRAAAAAAGAGGAAKAAAEVARLGEELAELGALGDGFGA